MSARCVYSVLSLRICLVFQQIISDYVRFIRANSSGGRKVNALVGGKANIVILLCGFGVETILIKFNYMCILLILC